ncbi:trihelix transcription factor DF1-like [Euphorbia lathyris]|uniref:trihelix transcription factor DF1-like n=1 Tax=Euphorbia lathyris TaxID=212925 RepID=UPI003313C440
MLANSTVLAPPPPPHDGADDDICGAAGGNNSNSGDDHDKSMGGDRMSYGGNRWPRQETLALLKIRSDMDAVFRDSSVKGPLWEEVSRKLAELGYHRNSKKCKEKFENVYKYHRRTKEGRTGKSEGKTYRFFDQLEAFGASTPTSTPQLQLPAPPQPPQKPPPQPQAAPMAATTTLPWSNPPTISHATVPSTTNHHHQQIHMNISPIPDPIIDSPNPLSSSQPLNPYPNNTIFPSSFQNLTSHLFSSSTSSSTASDEEMQGSRKRKRRWKDFFERLTQDVIKKQEDLQRKFLETVEKQEQERIAREETWRAQEISRINREHEILIQERTTAAAKDAALIAFLQKISGQQISLQTVNVTPPPLPPLSAPQPLPVPVPAPAPAPVVVVPAQIPEQAQAIQARPAMEANMNIVVKKDNAIGASPSRWPKVEVEALIRLRTNLDIKYLENGPKGPLWEEISGEMKKLGYNRSSKRCKEKWENINKYFKKVKENRKNRPEDSKTCPYFHQLNAIYKDRSTKTSNISVTTTDPLMVRPEQQWPESHRLELNGRDNNMEEDEYDDEMDTEEEDEGGGEFQVVASKPLANIPVGNGVC